jgi:hypothetical protein
MAEIEIGPIADRLSEEEIEELRKGLEKLSAPKLGNTDDGAPASIAVGLDDDVLAEFLDRLEIHELACEIYLPMEFEGRLEVGDLRVGSAVALLEILGEIKEDLLVDDEEIEDETKEASEDEDADEEEEEDEEDEDEEDEEEEDDDEDDYDELDLIENQLRRIWKFFKAAAETAIARKLPMYVMGD